MQLQKLPGLIEGFMDLLEVTGTLHLFEKNGHVDGGKDCEGQPTAVFLGPTRTDTGILSSTSTPWQLRRSAG